MVRIEIKDERIESKRNKQNKNQNSCMCKTLLSFKFQNCLTIRNSYMPELTLGNIGLISFMME
jgi:hypothetical protein